MSYAFTDWEGTCLAHHGIKGQKWGVRRYQNPDGTLTPAGKKREQKRFYKDMKRLGKTVKTAGLGRYSYESGMYAVIPRKKTEKLADIAQKKKNVSRNNNSKYYETKGAIVKELLGKYGEKKVFANTGKAYDSKISANNALLMALDAATENEIGWRNAYKKFGLKRPKSK